MKVRILFSLITLICITQFGQAQVTIGAVNVDYSYPRNYTVGGITVTGNLRGMKSA